MLTTLTIPVRMEYRNEHRVKGQSQTLSYSGLESYFQAVTQCFTFSILGYKVLLNMDAHGNPRRALKSAQEQKDRQRRRIERDRAQRAAETAEQRSERLRERRERDRARRIAQTSSE